MSIVYSAALYGGTLALAPLALVNPLAQGLQHEYKMAILFGLLPAMIKMISMAGEAQISTKVVLGTFVITMISHLILRAVSDKYKESIETPSKGKPTAVILSWVGISIIYTLVMLLLLFALGKGRFNDAAKVSGGGSVPTPA